MNPTNRPQTASEAERVRLPLSFYARHSTVVAPELLGKVLVAGDTSGRISEVEAYAGDDDPASHAFRGRTNRNAAMFGAAGHLYVYFTYGMHFCANVVTSEPGVATAVLLRAIEPIDGIEMMIARRGRSDNLADGPGKVCQALGIDRADDGTSLLEGPIGIYDDGWTSNRGVLVSPRIGITKAVDAPWRWRLAPERTERLMRRSRGATPDGAPTDRRRSGGNRSR